MLLITQSQSIAAAEKYFDAVLTQGDYYVSDQEINGTWQGKGAAILGVGTGCEVTKEQFKRLLSGIHPVTGKKLAQRIRKDRRPGVDLTFSLKKSPSLIWAINKDERIIEAFREAVHETITKDVEPLVFHRVRKGKNANSNQRAQTSNLIYADFLHKTSRPVDGQVDPHLHIHAFVMNYTTDGKKHYAADLEEVFAQRSSLEAKFDARLIRKLRALGYEAEHVQFQQSGRKKSSWELRIDGIERDTIEKFSRRTAQIEAYAKEHAISDAAEKGKLGLRTREAKDKGATVAELRQHWRSRLTSQEQQAFDALAKKVAGAIGEGGAEKIQTKLEASIRYALDHHLYRQSTVEKHTVVGTALEHGLTLSPEQVEAALETEDVIHRTQDVRGAERQFITTREVLEAETRMIGFARSGRGTRMAIARTEHTFTRDWLNSQQKDAVNHVLFSRDTVTVITGGAGTGKTTITQEAVSAIESNGKRVFLFAPSTGGREALEENGFQNAQTVEHLLRNEKLHPELRNQVLWVDEAGLLDVRSMNGVFDIAKAQNARVVLSGDTRQHSSPRRGEAMRILEAEAGLNTARIDVIQRQAGRYRRAVELISQGHRVVNQRTGKTGMLAGFDLLDRMGKIKEISADQRHEILANQYLESATKSNTPLVVAPTHAEGRLVTEHIREKLREAGAIGKQLRTFTQLQSLNLTEAEKSIASSFDSDGMVVQFHQNVKGGFTRGERYEVCRDRTGDLALRPVTGGTLKSIPFDAASRFEVYRKSDVEFAVGDKIRFSLGGKASDGKRRISNGRLDEVTGFDRVGNLKLKSGMKIPLNYGHWDLGYCITSHASQGLDSKLTIAAIGAQSLPAVNAKQFYVTVSRGREDVAIYVDDKEAVRRTIQNVGEQLSATELVHSHNGQKQQIILDHKRDQRMFLDRVRDWWQSHFPSRKSSLSMGRSSSVQIHHTPEFSRS